ncbi:MAG TPA: Fur family transcriptional regulator [Candidatus Polarisedimenticolia bacterium]|nr:Fur family transcriptional regulator [Candidatus Polarisedimenticolia bacterium]
MAHRPQPLASENLDALLREGGGRVTRQRRAVYAALAAHGDHPSAETLHREVRRRIPGISLATVYKALEVLVRSGAATRIAHSDGVSRYDVRTDDHDHLRCLDCGRVEDFDRPHRPERLADVVSERFTITGYRLEFLGYCAACDSARSVPPATTLSTEPSRSPGGDQE